MPVRAFALALATSIVSFACSSDEGGEPAATEDDTSPPQQSPAQNGPGNDDDGDAPGAPLDPPSRDDGSRLENLARGEFEDLLLRTCGQCHSADSNQVRGGIDYIDNLDELIETGRIVPGNPEASLIYQRIERGEMPPANVEPRVTDEELEAMARFITRLRAPAPQRCDARLMEFDEIYETIVSDIFNEDADDRRFLRYIGLSNRYNAGVCGAELDAEREAVGKAVNSFSTETRIAAPRPIGRDGVVLRIDIRDYGWDRDIDVGGDRFDDGWEAIIAFSPYAVEFEGDEANLVKLAAETTVPYLFADALIEQASVGDLYYGLIDVPETKDELLRDLGIDVEDNFDREIVVRAGFTNSAISRQDRVVERHPVLGGQRAFWDSFDFGNQGGESIFVNPFDFNEGGSQSIFSLPNGLHGYVIFDEDGDRQEETNLLFDSSQNDFTVRSAVSCMTCHAQGLIDFRDEVRQFAFDNPLEFNSDDFRAIRELYPSPDDMATILEDDRRIYRAALSRAGVSLSRRTDPISDTFLRFQRRVEIDDVAGDLHFRADLLPRELVRLNPALAGLRSGFRIDRDDWSALYLESLCVMQVASSNRPLDDLCDDVLR